MAPKVREKGILKPRFYEGGYVETRFFRLTLLAPNYWNLFVIFHGKKAPAGLFGWLCQHFEHARIILVECHSPTCTLCIDRESQSVTIGNATCFWGAENVAIG